MQPDLFDDNAGAHSDGKPPCRPVAERGDPKPTTGTGLAASREWVKLSTRVLARSDLPPASKLVLAVIYDRIGENAAAWPGVRSLAMDTGLSVTTVLESIGRLEGVGLLAVERAGPDSGRRSNRYRIPERSESVALQKKSARKLKRSRKRALGIRSASALFPERNKNQLTRTN